MGVPGNANALLLKQAAAAGGYEISRSVRLNAPDSAYLSRTPASSSNKKTWTWAGWVKRSKLGTEQAFFSAGNSSPAQRGHFRFRNIDALVVTEDSGGYEIISTQVFRDVGAWFHLVVAFDSTQSTSTDRIKVYINGSQITTFSTATYPTQNFDSVFNTTDPHRIGELSYAGNIYELDAYLADLHWIDSQALTPSAFGEFDTNGVWQPKAFSGSYGTNGFHLDFADNSTAAALGTDTSLNGNTWTVNNLSVTAGAGNDSLVDSPTNGSQVDTGAGGEVVGNYATLNPLDNGGALVLTNGNLEAENTTGNHDGCRCTIKLPSSGKWYYEGTVLSPFSGTTANMFGAATGTSANPGLGASGTYYILVNASGAVQRYIAGVSTNYTGFSTPAIGSVLQVAYDADSGKLWFGLNNLWMDGSSGVTGSPSTGSNETVSSVYDVFPSTSQYSTKIAVNFGQRQFSYAAPAGFKALTTANLPEGTITTSGTFTGNANADGPFVWLNGVPTAMTINSNAVTFGTHADKLANGFKLRTNSTSYNTSGSNTYSITTTGAKFKNARAQSNP